MKTSDYAFAALAGALMLTACGGGEDAGPEPGTSAVATFMLEEMDTTADGIWDNAGYVLTEEGEESLFPETDEEWAVVIQATDDLIAQTRRLQSDEFSDGDPEWIAISEGLVVAAQRVRDAAEARDEDELFDAGGQVYRVCLACHQRYALNAGRIQ